MDTWKLQKLAYFCQAWHLVWDGEPLFDERIEAWANGPVVRDLYEQHRGEFRISEWPSGDIDNLSTSEKESIEVVLKHYGRLTGYALREQTHREPPWKDARKGLSPGERSNREITLDAMVGYYGSL
jgi:uncharacterized phage-associated protein